MSLCYAVTSILVFSVIFVGSFIKLASEYLHSIFGNNTIDIFAYSPHYIKLLITIFAVVPIALAIISTIPFFEYERRVLKKLEAISFRRKLIMIMTRIFSHIIYFVIPKIILVKKEESHKKHRFRAESISENTDIISNKGGKLKQKIYELISEYFQIGIAGVRSSIEYIPLWALEIYQLPSKTKEKK